MERRTLASDHRGDFGLEAAHLPPDLLAEVGGDDAQTVHDEVRARHLALELVVVVQRVHLLLAAADQEEAGEIATVRLQQARLEALDPAVALELAVELDGLAEDLD